MRGAASIDGAKLRRLRREQALTLAELSERSGVADGTISRLENERRPAMLPTIRKLSEAFGIEPKELMKGD